MNQVEAAELFAARKFFLDQFFLTKKDGHASQADKDQCVARFLTCLQQLPDRALTYRAKWAARSLYRRAGVRGLMLGQFFQLSLARGLNMPDTPVIFGRWKRLNGSGRYTRDSGFLRIDHRTRNVVEWVELERFRESIMMLAWNEFDHFLANYL